MLADFNFEKLCRRIVNQPDFLRHLLLGGLIGFIPFLLAGYFYRYSLHFRETGSLKLPDWPDWRVYLRDTLFALGASLPYLLPLWAVAYCTSVLLYGGFDLIGLDFVAQTLGYLPLTLAFFVSLPLALACIYIFQTRQKWSDLLQVEAVFRLLNLSLRPLLLPLLTFAGLMAVGFPLYGFAFFAGLCGLVPYTFAVFSMALQNQP